MKDAEHTIERLLAGLRDAEPRPGLEHRIFKAMQSRETVASVPYWNRLRPPTLPAFAVWLASASAIIGALVGVVLHQRPRVPVDSRHAPALAVLQDSHAEAIAQKVPVPVRPQASRVWPRHSRNPARVPDLRIASFPAPPLPLTEQEKLLIRLVHSCNPEDIAILNPATQAAQSAKSNEEFQQFFRMNATEMRSQLE